MMGWTGRSLPTPGWFLYTRGGAIDVYIQKIDDRGRPISDRVDIPDYVLKNLVANDIRSNKISAFEQMDDDEILGL